jgi:5-methylcytosine-specific restriction endonuclease McrA
VVRRCSYTDEQFETAVKHSLTYAEVLSKVGLIPAGGNYSTLRARIQALGLDTSHFRGKGWARGRHPRPRSSRTPLETVLVEHSLYQSHKLKLRLIEAGVFARFCSGCGNAQWRRQPIPLELDHINGIRTDNRIENLRLLCPNCHALTGTYRAKNKGMLAGVVERHTRSS